MIPSRLRHIGLVAVTAALTLVTGCGEVELLSGLGQGDAVKIQVLLTDAGIDADKVEGGRGKDVTWSLMVASKEAAKANALLVKHGVLEPRREVASKESSLPSEPGARRARELRQKESDLEETLRRVPDVIWARVHLSVPEPRSPWSGDDVDRRASASVVMSVWRTESDPIARGDAGGHGLADTGGAIGADPVGAQVLRRDVAAQVAFAVGGLDPADVAVSIYTVGREAPFAADAPSSPGRGRIALTPSLVNLVLGAMVALLAGLLGVFARQNHRLAQSLRDA